MQSISLLKTRKIAGLINTLIFNFCKQRLKYLFKDIYFSKNIYVIIAKLRFFT